MDASDLLGMVRVPTLVLHRSDEFIRSMKHTSSPPESPARD